MGGGEVPGYVVGRLSSSMMHDWGVGGSLSLADTEAGVVVDEYQV